MGQLPGAVVPTAHMAADRAVSRASDIGTLRNGFSPVDGWPDVVSLAREFQLPFRAKKKLHVLIGDGPLCTDRAGPRQTFVDLVSKPLHLRQR